MISNDDRRKRHRSKKQKKARNSNSDDEEDIEDAMLGKTTILGNKYYRERFEAETGYELIRIAETIPRNGPIFLTVSFSIRLCCILLNILQDI